MGRTCSLYACINEARLTGTVRFPTTPDAIDATICSQGECKDGLIDVTSATATQEACVNWELSSVCLQPSGDGFALRAVWANAETPVPPDDTEYHLMLVDHATGETLLDVTRTMTYSVSRQDDDCHHCWSGQAAL